jgi:5-methylcytosine-specific restriction enzyme B
MAAAREALGQPKRKFLLHIDEINRADLGKILGEAIYLLEPQPEFKREIDLPYDFGEPFHSTLFLPENLHILGTMNSADRSIAILDIAVRRRFAFVSLWPSMQVVAQAGSPTMQKAYRGLVSIFVEHAPDEAFSLVPGHSYFLEPDETRAAQSLRVNLAPLLEEYLAQGYVSGFGESIRSYLQWLDSL